MRVSAAVLGAVLVAVATSPSLSAVRITSDPGGQIGPYMAKLDALRNSGQSVIIDGSCLSACTMVLGVIPRDRLCVTPRARLGFHAAWRLNEAGRQVTSPDGTELLMSAYPQPVRDWIARRGGLSPRLMYLTGNELASMYPVCQQGQKVAAGDVSGPKGVLSDPSTSAFASGKSPRRRFHP
jgi:hypothetical protein